MRKIIVGAFVSLDGVMQAPGGPQEDPTGGFRYGGWVAGHWDEAVGQAIGENFAEPFDLLLGRRTYDIFAAHWPHVQIDPSASDFDAQNLAIAERFNSITKYVATHRPESLTWQNSQGLGDDVVASVRALKQQDGPNLMTHGSTELLHQLLAVGLVDRLQLITFPIVLGKGKRLFDEGSEARAFELVKSSTTSKGVVISSYERAGEVATASFAMENPTDEELERRRELS